jgi:hypothetical protein
VNSIDLGPHFSKASVEHDVAQALLPMLPKPYKMYGFRLPVQKTKRIGAPSVHLVRFSGGG